MTVGERSVYSGIVLDPDGKKQLYQDDRDRFK